MATAFDGLGMGMLGSERQYINKGGPISEALKGLKEFAMVQGIAKSGLQEYLNKMGSKDNQGVPPPDGASSAINPVPVAPVPFSVEQSPAPTMEADPVQNQADRAFGIQSSVTPNLFQPRDLSQDQMAMQMQASAPPPANVGQNQMGRDIPSGGGLDLSTIAAIAKFFI